MKVDPEDNGHEELTLLVDFVLHFVPNSSYETTIDFTYTGERETSEEGEEYEFYSVRK